VMEGEAEWAQAASTAAETELGDGVSEDFAEEMADEADETETEGDVADVAVPAALEDESL